MDAISRGLGQPGSIIAVTGAAGVGKTTLVNSAIATRGPAAGPVRHVGGSDDVAQAWESLRQAASPKAPSSPLASPAEQALDDSPGILVIDDAHDATPDALGRLSTALAGSDARSRPHLVLVARQEFWPKLASPALAALNDMITVRAVLFPMPYAEAEQYVDHVFNRAGSSARAVMSNQALHGLIVSARGNMRQMNAGLSRTLAAGQGRQQAPPAGVPMPEPWAGGSGRGKAVAIGSALATVGLALAALFLAEPAQTWLGLRQDTPEPAAPDHGLAGPAATPLAPARPIDPSPTLPSPNPAPAEPLPARPEPGKPEPVTKAAPESEPAGLRRSPQPEPMAEPALVATPTAPEDEPTAAPPEPALPTPGQPPAPSPASVPNPEPPPGQPLPDNVIAALLKRGNAMLDLRDVSAARRLYERAARAGSAPAALALGGTYDPALRSGMVWEQEPDVSLAASWYQFAAALGDGEARARLKRLKPGEGAR